MDALMGSTQVLEAATALIGIFLVALGGCLSLLITYVSGWKATEALYLMCQWQPPWYICTLQCKPIAP